MQSHLTHWLDDMEEALDRAVAGYRQAVKSLPSDVDTVRRADHKFYRIQAKMNRLQRMKASSSWHFGDKAGSHEALLWKSLCEHRRTDFADVVRKVMLQNRAVTHWRSHTPSLNNKDGPQRSPRSSRQNRLRLHRQALNVYEWESLDVFKVEQECQRPLSSVFKSIWRSRHFERLCQTPYLKALEFAGAVEDAYKDIPYHNRMHAADVTQAAFFLWWKTSVLPSMECFFSDHDLLSLVVAAMIHDVAHPAVSNDFLTKTRDALALRYNDRSVLENFHAATGFEIMDRVGASLLAVDYKGLLGPSESQLRMRVIDMVLATDMAQHKQVVEAMAAQLDEHRSVQDVDKVVLEKHILHLSDLSHPLRPSAIHREWSRRVSEEFFAQGDQEKALGLSPMALYDRAKAPSMAKSQVGFLEFMVLPTWRQLHRILGDAGEELDNCLRSNLKDWKAEAEREGQELQASNSTSLDVNKRVSCPL
jgi:hypothetical protein